MITDTLIQQLHDYFDNSFHIDLYQFFSTYPVYLNYAGEKRLSLVSQHTLLALYCSDTPLPNICYQDMPICVLNRIVEYGNKTCMKCSWYGSRRLVYRLAMNLDTLSFRTIVVPILKQVDIAQKLLDTCLDEELLDDEVKIRDFLKAEGISVGTFEWFLLGVTNRKIFAVVNSSEVLQIDPELAAAVLNRYPKAWQWISISMALPSSQVLNNDRLAVKVKKLLGEQLFNDCLACAADDGKTQAAKHNEVIKSEYKPLHSEFNLASYCWSLNIVSEGKIIARKNVSLDFLHNRLSGEQLTELRLHGTVKLSDYAKIAIK